MAGRRTLAREVSVEGVALHAGVPARLKLCPAVAGTGLVFRRSDLPGRAGIPALWSQVAETRLGTELRGADGASVAVVEHLLAALSGAEIDDCMIEVDGPEPPALDLPSDHRLGVRARASRCPRPFAREAAGRGRIRSGKR
jgi:UDP-3-O-[3-hydroxymyristoyl] N-acetylglucosamine deacetylase